MNVLSCSTGHIQPMHYCKAITCKKNKNKLEKNSCTLHTLVSFLWLSDALIEAICTCTNKKWGYTAGSPGKAAGGGI